MNDDRALLLSESPETPVRNSGTQRCGYEGNLSQHEREDRVMASRFAESNLSRSNANHGDNLPVRMLRADCHKFIPAMDDDNYGKFG